MQQFPHVVDLIGEDIKCVERFSLPNGLSGCAVPDPGSVFSAMRQEMIFQALVPVTTSSFAADMTAYWAQRRQEDYFGRLAEFILVSDGDGQMVGWTGYCVFEGDEFVNLYIDSSGMVPREQSRGIMREIWKARLIETALPAYRQQFGVDRLYLSARTESPVIYRLLRGLVKEGKVYPDAAATIPEDVLACGRALAERLGQSQLLEPHGLILRNAYAMLDALYGELPTTGDPVLDQLFRKELGPLDAYLLVASA